MDLLLYIIGLSFIPVMAYVTTKGMLDIYLSFKNYNAELHGLKKSTKMTNRAINHYKMSVPYEFIA